MKNLLLILLFIPCAVFSQEGNSDDLYGKDQKATEESIYREGLTLPYKEGNVVYEKTVELPNTSKEVLFTGAKRWFAESFKNSKWVIQSEDKEAGQILGSANADVDLPSDGILYKSYNFHFNIMVSIKDNKYRIRFYDLIWHFGGPQYDFTKSIEALDDTTKGKKAPTKNQLAKRNKFITATNNRFNTLIEDFNNSLLKSKKDDF